MLLATPQDDESLEDLPAEQRFLTVGDDAHGQRLDSWCAAQVPELSRSYLQQLIADQAVTVDNVICTKTSKKVLAGSRVCIEIRPTPQSTAFTPEDMPIDVLFEDAHLLVINKPAGLVVHPAAGNWSGTLLNGLLARHTSAKTLPRAGIVHRLDKDTSGLMVVAKTRECMDALVRMLAAHDVEREYLALAARSWAQRPDEFSVHEPIGRDLKNRLRMAVVDLRSQPGKTAVTHARKLAEHPELALIWCQLETGRTHQIRVHLTHSGLPLVGDATYGGPIGQSWGEKLGMKRQALHAAKLSFVHPQTGVLLKFVANLPADFQSALATAGLGYNEPN
jgi:23S rRNA pseudouridine1911/1915/1917 synthase